MKLKLSSLLIAAALFGTAVMPAQASSDAMLELLKILRDKGTISTQDYELLANAAKADKEATKATEAKVEQVAKKAEQAPSVSLSGGHLKVKSAEGDFSAQIGGRIMADFATFDDDLGDSTGSEIRRARMFLKGTAYNDWGYKAQIDFAGSKVSLKDMYIQYKGFDAAKITLGNHKMPIGLEQQASSKYITFMERSITADVQEGAAEAGRSMGISSFSHGDNWTAAVAAHLEGTSRGFSFDQEEDWGAGGRITFAPISEKTKNIHLGASYHYQSFEDPGAGLKINFRPEAHLSSVKPFTTDNVGSLDGSHAFGLEAAAVWGTLSVQAEYNYFDTESSSGNTISNDPDFSTGYVYGSWFLTGESRNYNAQAGIFGRVKPKSIVGNGGSGAWELGIRYSYVDLENGGLGNKGNVTTLGLNWYATPTIRFMTNYNFVSADNSNIGTDDVDGNVLQMRGQIDF